MLPQSPCILFFFTATATPEIYTLSLHDALPIYPRRAHARRPGAPALLHAVHAHGERPLRVGLVPGHPGAAVRSEEHTSELQSRRDLVCRLLLEKKKKNY